MVFGVEPGGLGPKATDGRDAKASGEVVVDDSLGLDIGDDLVLGARTFEVVGTYSGPHDLRGIADRGHHASKMRRSSPTPGNRWRRHCSPSACRLRCPTGSER